MSVLVKGMEIPRNCWECEFNKSTLDRMDFCTLTNKQYNWGLSERPSDCSLVEVPDDVQPVVHGKWSEELVCGGMNEIWDYTCSVCGGVVHNPYNHMNYCPNCGARMDGDNNG